MLHRTFDIDGIVPGAFLPGYPLSCSREILEGEGSAYILRRSFRSDTLENHLSPVDSRQRPHVDEEVRSLDDFLVVFNHNHRVAYVPEPFQDSYEPVCIAGMKSDARFVQDVHRAHQRAAEGRDKTDSLTFTSGEGAAGPVKCKVGQSDIRHVLKPGDHLIHRLSNDTRLIFSKFQCPEEVQKLPCRHFQQLVNILSAHLDIEGILPETAALALTAYSPSGKAAEKIFVLYLVLVGFNPFEKLIEADEGVLLSFSLAPFPNH